MNAESLFGRGDYQGAITDFDRVIALNPNYIEAY
ncbi:MAG: tetratricopeptide repeat protein [Waterburya sp.]